MKIRRQWTSAVYSGILISAIRGLISQHGDEAVAQAAVFVSGIEPRSVVGGDDEAADVYKPASGTGRVCYSCGHDQAFHSEGGCRYTVGIGKSGASLVCPCGIEAGFVLWEVAGND